MAREKYVNDAESTLNGAINNSVTSITLTDASTFPTANFRLIIEDEILFCTSRASNVLTVVRGRESTTGASHIDTTPVVHICTAGSTDQIRLDTIYGAAFPRISSSPHASDDEFDDENFSGWTKVWQGTSPVVTEVEQDHGLSILEAPGGAAAQHTAYLKSRTIVSGDWVAVGFTGFFGPGSGDPQFGLCFADGTTYNSGNQVMFAFSHNESFFALRSATGFNAQTAINTIGCNANQVSNMMHLMLTYKGSNQWDSFISVDGIQWVKAHSNVSMGSMTPTHLGFAWSTWGATYGGNINVKYVRFKP